ncbi:MAG: ATP-binding protein [Planctomycetota bacterium]
MSQILLLETDPKVYQRWKERLETLRYSVDVIADDSDWALQPPVGKYPLAILRATYDQGQMNVANAILRERASSVMAIADNDDPALHRIAYQAGMDDCANESIDDTALGRKVHYAVQLQQLQRDLVQSEKLQSIGKLAAGIAHEINTPIQYVGDNTRFFCEACDDFERIFDACHEVIELLEVGEDAAAAVVRLREVMTQADLHYLRSEVPEAIHQTIDGVERVAAIVRAIKTYSHASSPEPTPTDIVAAIETTVTLARNEWKYVSNVDLDLDPTLTDVPCIGGQIHQVILNLIVNAAHAIDETLPERSAEKGVIRITAARLAERARIAISDNGAGIPEKVLGRIFEPFYTTKQAGKGTGQGLAIVKEIVVDCHGGSIDVETVPGQGTTFFIELPLQAMAASTGEEAVSHELAEEVVR